ncbi:Staphylococcus exoprotein expression protein R [Methanoculleus chikugoensis]|jgi:PAS domain S-box-containing protein|uniref:histidine kinase n=1 Tax=Methanoculleus chikugoensis TaxID=118126 RepID=A0A1M4MM91_9EURY|nr:PAS domain S-box protein [Methanoculleus chikugoensis]SCL76019.1 Staphylococcus exoprotein expression protein R [Methanoculleus chikugoensis]
MYRILVVDDEPTLLELNRIYLEQSGDMQVETTSSPLQALDMLSEAPYDAIVADYEMPEMDGITLLKEVRSRGFSIPFIIFSGRGREEVIIEALNNGADFYLQKGGNPSAQFAELQNMILQAVRRKEAEEEVQRAGDLYRSVFEHTGSATIIIEGDMTISLINSEAARLSGYSREEVEGKISWTTFVAPEDLERLTSYHRQRRTEPDSMPGTYEFRLVDRQGRRKDMHLTIGSIPGTDRFVASMIDVTDRKRFEEDLNAAHEEVTAAFEEARAGQEALEAQCREMEDYQANLRGIINFLPDPTFVLDRAGKVTIWNRAIEEVTGVTKSRIIGAGLEAVCKAVPGLRSPLVAETVLSRVGGESIAREVHITSPPTGEEVCLWAKASPLYDAQGRLSGAIESLRDITESKRMEAQIQHRVDLEQVVSSISTKFIGLDPADLDGTLEETLRVLGLFLDVDRSYIFRFSPDLTSAENTHEWCAEGVEPQIDVLQNLPAGVISWGMEQIRARTSICISDIADLPQEAAAERDFLRGYGVMSIILVPIANADEILGVVGFETTRKARAWSDEDHTLLEIVGNLFADLFSRIRAQERLRESEERFRSLVERSHDCYIRATTKPQAIEYISPSCESLTGYTREEILSEPDFIRQLIHPDDRKTFFALLQERDACASQPYVFRIRRKDGRYIWVEACTIPVYGNDGRPVAIDYAIHDIDAWKQTEAALIQANKKLTLMNSIVRHDILNQVTVVLGHIALLRDQPLDPAVVAAFEKQQAAIEIIRSQIGFTRDYQDLGIRAPRWFPVEPLVTGASKALRPIGIRISTELNGLSVYADPLLSSVFFNLLENAVRHGKTVTEIRVTVVPDGGGARIVWEDNGVGVPGEHKERIFERGFGSHTGLGLFLVKEVLSITGIAIRETGEPGRGARFEMAVPEEHVRYG